MTANLPKNFPEALIDSKILTQAFMETRLSPEIIRSDPVAMAAVANGEVS